MLDNAGIVREAIYRQPWGGPCVGGWSLALVTWRTDDIHRGTILKLS